MWRKPAAPTETAVAQGTSAAPAEVVPWHVVFIPYWPGSSSSVVKATLGTLGLPHWSCTHPLLTLAAAVPPHAMRFLSVAIAAAHWCLPVSIMLTLSGVREPDRGAVVGRTEEEDMAGGEAGKCGAGRDVGFYAKETLLPITLP